MQLPLNQNMCTLYVAGCKPTKLNAPANALCVQEDSGSGCAAMQSCHCDMLTTRAAPAQNVGDYICLRTGICMLRNRVSIRLERE